LPAPQAEALQQSAAGEPTHDETPLRLRAARKRTGKTAFGKRTSLPIGDDRNGAILAEPTLAPPATEKKQPSAATHG